MQDLDEMTLRIASDACNMPSPQVLRHRTSSCAWVQHAYFSERLRIVHRSPWSVCRSNPQEALDVLVRGSRPDDETLGKIYDMAQFGMHSRTLLDTLELMRNVPWTSTIVEQGHVYASRMKRYHQDYSSSTLATRIVLSSVRSQDERLLMQLRRSVVSTRKRKPQCTTGRQMFYKELIDTVQSLRSEGREFPADINKRVVKGHTARWKTKSAAERGAYHAKALVHREQRFEELRRHRDTLAEEIERVEKRVSANVVMDKPLSLSNCRFTNAQVQQFVTCYLDPKWQKAVVADLRRSADLPASRPSDAFIEQLEGIRVDDEITHDRPPWVQLLANHRESFRDSAVRFQLLDGSRRYFKFCFAKQSPLLVVFAPLAETTSPSSDSTLAGDPLGVDTWTFAFETQDPTFVYSDDGSIGSDWPMEILFDVFFVARGGRLGSQSTWQPWQAVSEQFGLSDRYIIPEEPVAPKVVDDVDYEECPWLLDLVGPHATMDAASRVLARR